MQVVTRRFEVYSYDELTQEAKEKAHMDYRNNQEYFWLDEIDNSIKAIGSLLDIELEVRDIYCNTFRGFFDYPCDLEDLSGSRAIAWIHNHVDFKKPAYKLRSHKGYKKGMRHALPLSLMEDTMLTGYCADYILHEAYKLFIERLRKHPTLKLNDFFELLADAAAKEYENEVDYQNSEEYFADLCEANDYTFLADGTFFR